MLIQIMQLISQLGTKNDQVARKQLLTMFPNGIGPGCAFGEPPPGTFIENREDGQWIIVNPTLSRAFGGPVAYNYVKSNRRKLSPFWPLFLFLLWAGPSLPIFHLSLQLPILTSADWGAVSAKLCRELMRYDAANIPNGTKRFNIWAKGGLCPYNNLNIKRVAHFIQDSSHWKPGPAKSAYELMVMCIRENCKDSDYHTKY